MYVYMYVCTCFLNVQKGCSVSAHVSTRFIIDPATPQADAIIPWRPEDILENAAANKPNYRKIPMGLIASTDNQAVVHKEAICLVCMYVCMYVYVVPWINLRNVVRLMKTETASRTTTSISAGYVPYWPMYGCMYACIYYIRVTVIYDNIMHSM
jgi:hypothetical protein